MIISKREKRHICRKFTAMAPNTEPLSPLEELQVELLENELSENTITSNPGMLRDFLRRMLEATEEALRPLRATKVLTSNPDQVAWSEQIGRVRDLLKNIIPADLRGATAPEQVSWVVHHLKDLHSDPKVTDPEAAVQMSRLLEIVKKMRLAQPGTEEAILIQADLKTVLREWKEAFL